MLLAEVFSYFLPSNVRAKSVVIGTHVKKDYVRFSVIYEKYSKSLENDEDSSLIINSGTWKKNLLLDGSIVRSTSMTIVKNGSI